MVNSTFNYNLLNRTFTALILIPIVTYIVIKGCFLFNLFLALVFIISMYEVTTILNNEKKKYSVQKLLLIIAISIYIGIIMLVLVLVVHIQSTAR